MVSCGAFPLAHGGISGDGGKSDILGIERGRWEVVCCECQRDDGGSDHAVQFWKEQMHGS